MYAEEAWERAVDSSRRSSSATVVALDAARRTLPLFTRVWLWTGPLIAAKQRNGAVAEELTQVGACSPWHRVRWRFLRARVAARGFLLRNVTERASGSRICRGL